MRTLKRMYIPQNIPLDAIDTGLLPRDRTVICAEAQTKLQSSIAQNGLRIPIEVYKTDTGFALISGYRRLLAYQSLHSDNDQYAQIRAILREPADKQAALAAMVEENEIRQNPAHGNAPASPFAPHTQACLPHSTPPLPRCIRKSAARNTPNYAPQRKWLKPLMASL